MTYLTQPEQDARELALSRLSLAFDHWVPIFQAIRAALNPDQRLESVEALRQEIQKRGLSFPEYRVQLKQSQPIHPHPALPNPALDQSHADMHSPHDGISLTPPQERKQGL